MSTPTTETKRAKPLEALIAVAFGVVALGLLTVGMIVAMSWKLPQSVETYTMETTPARTETPIDNVIVFGDAPTDICLIDGKPQILSVDYEGIHNYSWQFSYINREGDIVSLKYRAEVPYHATSRHIWRADFCPPAPGGK